MEPKDLQGKTIASAEVMMKPGYDDDGWLKLDFTDGSSCVIESGYGSYTGGSKREYPTGISVEADVPGLVPSTFNRAGQPK